MTLSNLDKTLDSFSAMFRCIMTTHARAIVERFIAYRTKVSKMLSEILMHTKLSADA